MKRPRRIASNLSESVHHQLNMYALAASAAGVGILALAQPAEAKIVYTSANHTIKQNARYNLDLNHDRKADFTIVNLQSCNGDYCVSVLTAVPALPAQGGNFVEGGVYVGFSFAYALKGKAIIGPKDHFVGRTMAYRGEGGNPHARGSTSKAATLD